MATPAALVVSKSHKLGERQSEPGRLNDKDAHDLVDGFLVLLADPRSEEAARQALAFLSKLFAAADSLGSVMAGRVEEGLGDPGAVAASVSILVGELTEGVNSATG